MAADNVIANAGAGGATFRTFSDGTIEWPASIVTYVNGGSAGAWTLQQVDATHGLPTTLLAGTAVIGHVIVDSGTVTTVSTVTAVTNPVTVVGDAASGAANAGNPVKVGGAFNTTQPTVTNGQAVDAQYTARGAAIVATGIDTFTVTANAGTGTFTVSGTVTANAGTNLNTSLLALDTSVNGILLAQGSTTSGQTGPLLQGAVTTNAPSYTTAKTDPLSLDTSGLLRVSLKDTPANTNKFLVTPDSVALPAHQSVNVDQLNGTTTDTNSGNKSAGTLRVVLATDQPQLTNKLLVTPDAGSTVQPISGTTGGATPFRYIIAAGANQDSQNVKGSAGTVYSIDAFLAVGTLRYLKLYDKATAPTSADTPVHTFLIPGNTAGAGFTKSIPVGMLFANGIGFRVTTGLADNDTGSATANDGVINLDYK